MVSDFQPYIVGIGGTARVGSTTEQAVRTSLAVAERLGARTRMFGGAFLTQLPLYAPEEQTRTTAEKELVAAVREAGLSQGPLSVKRGHSTRGPRPDWTDA